MRVVNVYCAHCDYIVYACGTCGCWHSRMNAWQEEAVVSLNVWYCFKRVRDLLTVYHGFPFFLEDALTGLFWVHFSSHWTVVNRKRRSIQPCSPQCFQRSWSAAREWEYPHPTPTPTHVMCHRCRYCISWSVQLSLVRIRILNICTYRYIYMYICLQYCYGGHVCCSS